MTKKIIDYFLKRLPYTSNIMNYKTNFVPPGHYYSPLPELKDVIERQELLFKKKRYMEGIDFNEEQMLNLLKKLEHHYDKIPFEDEVKTPYRYYFNNRLYSYSDAVILFTMLLEQAPNKIIEVGSGFSSALMLDANDFFFEKSIEFTFIEPYPEERLNILLKGNDYLNNRIVIHKEFIQNMPLSTFKKLEAGDILFIDSSHVSKIGSDVNFYIFEIFPVLKPGVIIHIHDIFTSFEYPKEWVLEEIAWNEAYILRAFLQYNEHFKIIFFNSYMEDFHEEWYKKNMPLCLRLHEKRPGKEKNSFNYHPTRAQSIWLKKIK